MCEASGYACYCGADRRNATAEVLRLTTERVEMKKDLLILIEGVRSLGPKGILTKFADSLWDKYACKHKWSRWRRTGNGLDERQCSKCDEKEQSL